MIPVAAIGKKCIMKDLVCFITTSRTYVQKILIHVIHLVCLDFWNPFNN